MNMHFCAKRGFAARHSSLPHAIFPAIWIVRVVEWKRRLDLRQTFWNVHFTILLEWKAMYKTGERMENINPDNIQQPGVVELPLAVGLRTKAARVGQANWPDLVRPNASSFGQCTGKNILQLPELPDM